MEEFDKAIKEAMNAFSSFELELYKTINKNYNQLENTSSVADLEENENYFMKTPDEHDEEFINMIRAGLTGKEAYDLLKDTYIF